MKLTLLIFSIILTLVNCFVSVNGQQTQKKGETQVLKLNQPIELQIKGGETHTFEFKLKKGEFARVEVVPTFVDVIVTLFDSAGKPVVEMEVDNTFLWLVSFSTIANSTDSFTIQVKEKPKSAYSDSRFIVKLIEKRKPTTNDTKRIEAEKTLLEAIKLGQANKTKESAPIFEKATLLWKEVGDKYWEAITIWNLAYAYYFFDDYVFNENDNKVLKLFNEALPVFQQFKDPIGESSVFHGIGTVYRYGKKNELAKEYLEKGLAIRKDLKRLISQYNSLNALILIYYNLKQNEKVFESQNIMLAIADELDDKNFKVGVFKDIGKFYLDTNQYDQSFRFYEKALLLNKELGLKKDEFNLLSALIAYYFKQNQSNKLKEVETRMLTISDELKDKSLEARTFKDFGQVNIGINNEIFLSYYEKALPIYKELKDKENEKYITMMLGLGYGTTGEYEKTRVYLEQYAEIVKELGEKGNWNAFQFLGMAYDALELSDKALANFEKALDLAKTIKDNRFSEGEILYNLGSFYSKKRQFDKAKTLIEDSLQIAKNNKNDIQERSSLNSLASLYLSLRDFKKAEEYNEQSLAIHKRGGKANEANGLSLASSLYIVMGNYNKAKEYSERANKLYEDVGNELSQADSLSSLGLISASLGNYEEAILQYSNALKIVRAKNNLRKIITALKGLGSANSSLGRFEEAKQCYEDVVKITEKLETRNELGDTFNSLANIYINLSQFDKAKTNAEKALDISQKIQNKFMESFALTNLGKVYSSQNQYDEAREYFEKVLAIANETKNIFGEYDALTNLGFVYLNLGKYDKAKEYLEKAGQLSKEIKTIQSGVDVAYGLGAIYVDLSNPEKATNLIKQSLEIVQNAKNRRGEGIILTKLGEIAFQSKDYQKAKEYYEKALSISRDVKNVAGEASALISLGEVLTELYKFSEAKESYEKGFGLCQQINNPSGQGSALNGLGELAFKQKNYQQASNYYQQASPFAKQSQIKKLESRILKNIMEFHRELKQPQVAIIYGKQAVNIFQEIRGNIKGFEKESQQSYLKDKESAYRTLADLLVAQERFSEAQAVLNFLKEEEYSQLARTVEKREIISYSDIEKKLLENFENLTILQKEKEEVLKTNSQTPGLLQKVNDLQSKINQANQELSKVLNSLATAELTVKPQILSYKNINLADLRKRTNTGVVALYTLLGKESETSDKAKFGWVILVTESFQQAYPIDITNLKENVFQFKEALSSDKYDPRPLGQKLYQAIFRQKSTKQKRTLEQDLNAILGKYPKKTLMWSLDGVLRYIPMAALHDGNRYLAETYLNTTFTDKSIGSLGFENSPDWKVLGLGVSEKRDKFNELPGVKIELETIVKEANTPKGILNGSIKLNSDFKKDSFNILVSGGDFPVVHIASHYSYLPTQPKQSFLLAGDGNLTFADMEQTRDLFSSIDLLTLSACDTGVSENGKEAEGFGYKAQELGAKSVIASLWKVSDKGTPELMIRFYKLQVENPNISKGEAFRQSQLSLLDGETKPAPIIGTPIPRAEIVASNGKINLPLFVQDKKAPFAHPHYWASFVLIGNWR